MENELKQLIEAQQKKIDEMYITIEKVRKYMQWTFIASIVFFVLPLILAVIAIPIVMSSYTSMINGFGI